MQTPTNETILEGLAGISKGIDAALAREKHLRNVLSDLMAYLDYMGGIEPREEACNCPLDENDTQCGICLGRSAYAEAEQLLVGVAL